MTWEHTLTLIQMSAFGLIATLLAWAVRQAVTMSQITAGLTADVRSLDVRVISLEAARIAAERVMQHVHTDVAFVRGFLEGNGKAGPGRTSSE
jgi:hypothetical protein